MNLEKLLDRRLSVMPWITGVGIVLMLSMLLLSNVGCASSDDPQADDNSAVAEQGDADTTNEEPTPVPATATAEPAPTDPPAEPTETPEPAEPTATAVPATETPAPTATDAPPTETPEPTPVPPTPTPEFVVVEADAVQLAIPSSLGVSNVQVETLPAQLLGADGPTLFFPEAPDYTRVSFDTDQGPGVILVEQIRDAAGLYYASQPDFLNQYYDEFDFQLEFELDGRLDQQQITYIDFENGKALRTITFQFETFGPQKITNETLYYFVDGVTDDGRNYVSMAYPISADLLDDSGQFTAEELAAATDDFDSYVLETMEPLNELELADFTPDLALLDELAESINVITLEPEIVAEADPAEDEAEAAAVATAEAFTENDPNCTNDSIFIEDVTIPDATVIEAGESFGKVWRVQNAGSCFWTGAYTAVFVSGDEMGWSDFVEVDLVSPGQNFDIAVTLQAPAEPGIYEGRWQMVDENLEPFGTLVYVTIVVPESE